MPHRTDQKLRRLAFGCFYTALFFYGLQTFLSGALQSTFIVLSASATLIALPAYSLSMILQSLSGSGDCDMCNNDHPNVTSLH